MGRLVQEGKWRRDAFVGGRSKVEAEFDEDEEHRPETAEDEDFDDDEVAYFPFLFSLLDRLLLSYTFSFVVLSLSHFCASAVLSQISLKYLSNISPIYLTHLSNISLFGRLIKIFKESDAKR